MSLLLCAPATGSKTADNGTTAETSDDASGETTTSSSSSSPSIEHRGRYAGDSQRSMSTKTDVVGVQFYAPPVVHGTSATTTVGLYGRQLRPRYHRPQPTRYTHRQPHYYYRTTPWGDEPTATVLHTRDSGANTDGGGPILMNPLMSTYDDGPSTARYSSPFREQLPSRVGDKHAHRTQPTAMAEYHPGDVAPLTFLTAQPYDPTLLDHMPAIQLTLQNAADKAPPTLPSSVLQHHRHAAINRQPPAYGPSSALHQLQLVQHASHHPRHHHHHRHLPHNRYATTGRYTQVPFLYNLPAPPVQRNLAPTEYDLVTRFNRLLRQRERDYDDAPTAYRPAGAGDEFGVDAEDNDDDDEKVIHSSRPVAKPKRKKKTKKKKKAKTTKKKTPPPPPPPAPVEEEQQEEEDYDGLLQPQQGEDERADDDQQQQQPVSEEQESQNVITSQQVGVRVAPSTTTTVPFSSCARGLSSAVPKFPVPSRDFLRASTSGGCYPADAVVGYRAFRRYNRRQRRHRDNVPR